ncbi:PTS transporter subunit EIIC [Numidum massiliense]|uniref:PTS transporter subunit EIIC n=1 Tax=Numidum massiliense TaxID=1522315 RepID=UPI0006D568BA|nr:PTS transporter subunit EIIC [Numidum massiliense]
MSKEQRLAQQILDVLGGKDNIASVNHCMTRLRVMLRDESKMDKQKLSAISGVMGVVDSAGEWQIILGPGIVTKVTQEIARVTGLTAGEVQDLQAQIKDKNRTPFKLFLRKLANIFVPLIPAIVASGVIAGVNNIVIQSGADPEHILIKLLNVIGWGVFGYLAVFVGINTAKVFGGTPALGGAAGILLINPAIEGLVIQLGSLQIDLVPGRGGLIGAMLAAWFIAVIEKRIRKYVPAAIDIIVTPTLALLVTGFATYFVLQPLGGWASDGITYGLQWLIDQGGALSGAILAGTFLPLVMTGLHHGLAPIHAQFLDSTGMNPLLPILAMAGAGQVGAAFAIYFRTRNEKLRNVVKGALPVGILGIGEPLIFGVTLPLGRPFITACIGASFGGAYQAVMATATSGFGVSGLPLTFLMKTPAMIPHYLIGIFLAYLGGFVVTYFFGYKEEMATNFAPDADMPSLTKTS